MTHAQAPKAPKTLPPPSPWQKVKYKFYALALIGIIAFAGVMSALAYSKAFVSTIPVTLEAGRAGLQMFPGNRVKVQGVDLGRVKEVNPKPDQSGVEILLYLDPDLAAKVPVNAKVSLEQLTAFGNKTVQMTLPAQPSSETLRAGTALKVDNVVGEINGTFDELMRVLNEVQPAKLNAVLGAFAGALQGNGDDVGVTLTKANAYLKKLNTDLPALQRDFRVANGFANVYADAAPNIANTVEHLGGTSKTVLQDPEFGPAAISGTRVVDAAAIFFDNNTWPLDRLLKSLRPTTSLLKEYSPALTCFLDGAAQTWEDMNNGAFTESGVQFEAAVVLGMEAYKYPRDLPEIGPGAMKGPHCRGLPDVTAQEAHLADATPGPPGVQGMRNTPYVPKQPATVEFFGPGHFVPPSVKGGK